MPVNQFQKTYLKITKIIKKGNKRIININYQFDKNITKKNKTYQRKRLNSAYNKNYIKK